MDTQQIMASVVSLIIMSVGVFGVFTVTTVTDDQGLFTYSGSFTVTNSSQDTLCNTGDSNLRGITVKQWNGAVFLTVPTTDWSYTGSTVNITAGTLD